MEEFQLNDRSIHNTKEALINCNLYWVNNYNSLIYTERIPGRFLGSIYLNWKICLFAALQASNEGSIANTKVYRIEEVPKDELNLGPEELLVPVTHFYKEMHNAFGIPFFLKITNKETYASIRQRIKNRLSVPDKEWEKVCKF